MDQPLQKALERLVAECSTREELDRRVANAYGYGLLAAAYDIARERKGQPWIDAAAESVVTSKDVQSQRSLALSLCVFGRALLLPSRMILLVGSSVLLVIVLFPPFVLPLPEGLSTNAGFSFLFNPPRIGRLVALVNVGLLTLEIIATIALVAAVYILAKSIEIKVLLTK